MSVKTLAVALAIALADYLPLFGAIFGVTLFGVSSYFGNVTVFLLSIVIISVLPPVLEAVGRSLKEKYGAMQNEIDIVAMIPDWSLGLEMLASIAIMVASAVLRNIVVFYLGIWLLALGASLDIAKEINGLKEDLRSPDLERRRAAMEKVESDEQSAGMTSVLLVGLGVLIIIIEAAFGSANFTLVEAGITIALIFASLIPYGIVYERANKVRPPEPEKAARAAS
jgi:hypothetical protein